MAKISIILPSYNYGRFLERTIGSVLSQSVTDWELFVVEDGSADESAELIRAYAARDPRIRLLTHPNDAHRGMIESYRLGLKACSGVYVAFLEADDLWDPDHLRVRARVLDEHPEVAVAHGKVRLFGDRDVVREVHRRYRWDNFPSDEVIAVPFEASRFLLEFNFALTFSAWMTRREHLAGIDLAPKHPAWLDWWVLSQLSLRGPFFYIPEVTVNWRFHKQNYNRLYCSGMDEAAEARRFRGDILRLMKHCLEGSEAVGEARRRVLNEALGAAEQKLSTLKKETALKKYIKRSTIGKYVLQGARLILGAGRAKHLMHEIAHTEVS